MYKVNLTSLLSQPMKKAYQSSCEINLHHAFSCQPNTKENYSLFGSQSGTSSRPPERLSFLDSFLCSTLDQSLFVTILRNPYQPSVYAKWVLANSETNHYIEPCELSSITSKPFCFRFFRPILLLRPLWIHFLIVFRDLDHINFWEPEIKLLWSERMRRCFKIML